MTTEYLQDQIDTLRHQIENDQTLDVFDVLLGQLSIAVPDIYNEVLLQKSRYIRVEREKRMGLITRETADADRNRIKLAIMRLLDELPTKLGPKDIPVTPPSVDVEGLSSFPEGRPEVLLGINNLRQISWVAQGLESAKSVCRLLAPSGLGTGFLIDSDLLMTNNHVISSVEEAEKTIVEFNYQQAYRGGHEPTYRYRLDPTRFDTNSDLDYTVVGVLQIPDAPLLKQWGHLVLNPCADPVRGELTCIIHHPNGGLKQITLTANWVIGSQGHRLWYTTDTMSGSSGSPVFNDIWQVVAIHHAGGVELPAAASDGPKKLANEGILVSHIKPVAEAAGLWPTD